MNEITIRLREEKEKIPTGASKFFGNPDIWEDFRWPYITENGENYDLSFVCQINCKQAAAFDIAELLPKSGMLYFFYDLDEMPTVAYDKAVVLYFDGDTSMLHQMLLTDQDGNDIGFREMKIEFSATENNASANCAGQSTHCLLGSLPPDSENLTYSLKDRQILLKIGAIDTNTVKLDFLGGGSLCWLIDRNKLKSKDFSDIDTRQIC